MKTRFQTLILALSVSLCAKTQNVNTAYAITSEKKGSFDWTDVKQIDLSNGNVLKNVFESHSGKYDLYEGRSFKKIAVTEGINPTNEKFPFAGNSAACAYDAKSKRLYYAPMFLNQLRYIDLGSATPAVYIFSDDAFSNATDLETEDNHITRMVISPDGHGYAMSNDGAHLVKFTLGERPVVTDLGRVTDAPENGEVSISNANTSWGGDLLADASGNLYVVSALNHVFKIDVNTRVAKFIDRIKDLPEGFTSNGAVVNGEGNIVISSANVITSYYTVDPHNWTAKIIPSTEFVYNTSDLANQNLLYKTNLPSTPPPAPPVNPAPSTPVPETPDEPTPPATTPSLPVPSGEIAVYPNPVKTNIFRVNFANRVAGNYRLQVMDFGGRMVMDKVIDVAGAGQVSEVRLDQSVAKGLYMVVVQHKKSMEVYVKKIIID